VFHPRPKPGPGRGNGRGDGRLQRKWLEKRLRGDGDKRRSHRLPAERLPDPHRGGRGWLAAPLRWPAISRWGRPRAGADARPGLATKKPRRGRRSPSRRRQPVLKGQPCQPGGLSGGVGPGEIQGPDRGAGETSCSRSLAPSWSPWRRGRAQTRLQPGRRSPLAIANRPGWAEAIRRIRSRGGQNSPRCQPLVCYGGAGASTQRPSHRIPPSGWAIPVGCC